MNGVLCIDKPAGMTSFDVVARLRRIFHERRVGHAGTLDPMATGVLPVFFGEATRAVSLLPDQDKRYTAGLRPGVVTDTGDVTGSVLARREPDFTQEDLARAAAALCGEILQVPPMYSAVRVGGKHLYELAREGETVERAPRPVTVYGIGLLGREGEDWLLDIRCSKGTYIRVLCEDLGRALGCGATMASLRRTRAAGFSLADCVTLEQAEQAAAQGKAEELLRDVETVFLSLPETAVTPRQAARLANGGALAFARLGPHPARGLCRVRCGALFLGLAEARPEREELAVKCLFRREEALRAAEPQKAEAKDPTQE